MRVVVTNDDGIRSAGLHALASALVAAGHDVSVVAPAADYSGFAAAVGPLHVTGEVRFERVELASVPGVPAVAVEGPPALCVLSACLGGFGAHPEVVVSGINAGANTGRAVLHSGTVGAAFTANTFGLPSIAVSQPVGDVQHWSTAADAAAALVDWVAGLSTAVTLNVNVPNLPPGQLPVRVAPLDRGGEVQTAMFETGEGTLRLRPAPRRSTEGTDTAVLAAGCIAVTALHAVDQADVVLDGAVELLERSLGDDEQVA